MRSIAKCQHAESLENKATQKSLQNYMQMYNVIHNILNIIRQAAYTRSDNWYSGRKIVGE